MESRSLTAEGEGFSVKVTYGPESGIPKNANLSAAEIAEGADGYESVLENAAAAAGVGTESLYYLRFFDMEVADGNDEPVTGVGAVDVEITLPGKPNENDTLVIRLPDGGEAEVVEPAVSEETLTFGASGLNVLAVVETDTIKTITATASDGATVEITDRIPKGAEASITPVKLTKDQLIAYYGKEFVEAVDELVVYDICILVNGEEWEPDSSVSVVIKSPSIETKESNEEVGVTHLGDDRKSVDHVETEITEDGDIAFEAEGFSLWGLYTYTVDYYLNDNEYHQPGNTSMMLSELFMRLLVAFPVSEVADVEFTDYSLLQIDREGDDFRITSLKPFTSHEVMKVILKDGDWFTIVVEDLIYADYTYDSSALTPFTGTLNYVGHYDIFGGGNGLPSVFKDETNVNDPWANWWAGQWGGNSYWDHDYDASSDGTTVTMLGLQGHAVGNDQNGDALVAEPNKYKVGSSAVITWNGDLQRAFLSFSWLYYYKGDASTTRPTSLIVDIKLYAPNGDYTPIILNTTQEDDDGRTSAFGGSSSANTTSAWRLLSFEATQWIKSHGTGTYTMIVTLSVPDGYTMEYNKKGASVSDMGFTIYGVTLDNSRPTSAVFGVVDEIMIAQGEASLPNRAAEVTLPQSVTPRGNGKAWFNCQGGEYGSEAHDYDYLELKTKDGRYLKLGTGGDIPIPGWDANDIACPNSNQNPPSGWPKFQNRCSFGLASFSGLENKGEIVGVKKSMKKGNDCFGSLLMLVEVMPAAGTVEVTKKLQYDGNGVNTGLPQAGAERILKFHVEPTGDAPMPYKVVDGTEKPNQDFETHFNPGAHTGDSVLIEMGTFRFRNLTGSGPWTFVYEVTEDRSGTVEPWIYDSRTLLLTFYVSVDEANSSFKIDDYEWSVKDDPEDQDYFFKNDYVLPTELAVEKVSVTGTKISGAKFMLYSDVDCTTPAAVFTDEARQTALTADNAPASDSNGLVHFYGVDKDETYYLKEISVPSPDHTGLLAE